MLIVDSLSHAYPTRTGTLRVLTGVYLQVRPGEVVGVVGRNGCGKTTMLRALLGTLRADAMHLSVDGERVEKAYRSGAIAYLPQDPYLPRRFGVRRAIALGLAREDARAGLRLNSRIAPLLGKRVRDLSGGEQRYLEVLLNAHAPSPYCLLDEPFTEVEPLHRGPLGATIRDIAQESGRGFVVTDHAYRDVLEIADRVLVLADGVLRHASGELDLQRWGYTP